MTQDEFQKKLPELTKNYRPAAASLERIKNVSLLIIIGPSGVGKSSIISKLGLHYVPSDTTRDARAGEKEGSDFYFLNDYDQVVADIRAGHFLQVAVGPAGDFYATRASSYPESGLAVMPVVADVVPIFRRLGFKKTNSAFIVPPSHQEWIRRMQSHPVTPEQLAKRLAEAKRSLKFALNDSQTQFILNDDLDAAIQQTQDLLNGKTDQNRERLARQAAQANYDQLLKG